MEAPLSPLCSPSLAQRLKNPADLCRERLLRSYRPSEWTMWFEAASIVPPTLRGPMFDSSALMAGMAMTGLGVALAPPVMFSRELAAERLVQPFDLEIDAGRYWLTRLISRKSGVEMQIFSQWLIDECSVIGTGGPNLQAE